MQPSVLCNTSLFYISVITNYRIVIGKTLNIKPNHIVLHAVVSHIHYAY